MCFQTHRHLKDLNYRKKDKHKKNSRHPTEHKESAELLLIMVPCSHKRKTKIN